MERPRKIDRPLILPWLIDGNEQYGVRTATRGLLCALRDRDVSCPIVALSGGEFATECSDLGFRVNTLQRERIPSYRGSLAHKALQFLSRRQQEIRSRRAATAALQAIGADALNFCPPTLIGVAGPAAHANGIKSFWHVPNAVSQRYPFQLNRRMYQSWCSRFGIVPLANSVYTASTLGNSPVSPKVLYLGIDPRRFDPARVVPVSRSTLGIDAASIVIGVVARLDPSKGQAVVVEALLRLVADGHDIRLVVVGGPLRGEYYARMRNMLDQAGQLARVHFIGPVTDVERFYPLLDFSISSMAFPEAFGLSVVESMMSGCPALVHALGGPAETVVDGVTGWHYYGSDADSVSQALRHAISDRVRWPTMGAAARQHALENFSVGIQARNYLGIVEDVLNDSRRLSSAKA